MKVLALIPWLLAGPLATADETLDPVAVDATIDLVRITRVDELYWTLSRNASREMFAEKRITGSQLQCFESVEIETYTQAIAVFLLRDLRIEEIQSALDFYSSPTGVKFQHMAYQLNWEKNPKEFPLKVEGPKQSMNLAELTALGRFRDSAGGLRLSCPLTYLNRPEALSTIGAIFLETRMVCEDIK